MKRHRFIGDFDLSQDKIVLSDKELIHQVTDVLKLRRGEEAFLSNGNGIEVRARLLEIEKGTLIFEKGEVKKVEEPERSVTLYCSILKKENFELVIQKAVECGVAKIIPLLSARTVKTGLKRDRLEKIIKEACEQSGRGSVPVLGEPMQFKDALSSDDEFKIIFDATGKEIQGHMLGQSVSIFIGPEGGWTKEEMESANENGCVTASLGPFTLRGETAAIIATYLTVHAKKCC